MENYIQLGILIASIISSYLKTRADNKVSRKKSENSHILLSEKLDKIDKLVKESELSREFKENIEKAISGKAFDIIQANTDLTDNFINILNLLQIKVKGFAVTYSVSPYRKNKKAVKNYLEIEINTIREAVRHAGNDTFKGAKDGKTFSTFLKYYHPEITTATNVLISILTKNGLSKKEYMELFEIYINDLFLNYIKGWRRWERL